MRTKVKDKMSPSEKLITVESSDTMEVLLQKLFDNKGIRLNKLPCKIGCPRSVFTW